MRIGSGLAGAWNGFAPYGENVGGTVPSNSHVGMPRTSDRNFFWAWFSGGRARS